MSRRKPVPGQRSLFDVAPCPSPKVVEKKVRKIVEPVSEPCGIIEPPYMKNGAFIWPPGCDVDTSNKGWFCVCHPDGSDRDALAILYAVESRKGQPVAIICPALEQRWDEKTDYCTDCLSPFLRAAEIFAADTLALAVKDIAALSYVTLAWRGEHRLVQRDVGHLGNVTPRTKERAA